MFRRKNIFVVGGWECRIEAYMVMGYYTWNKNLNHMNVLENDLGSNEISYDALYYILYYILHTSFYTWNPTDSYILSFKLFSVKRNMINRTTKIKYQFINNIILSNEFILFIYLSIKIQHLKFFWIVEIFLGLLFLDYHSTKNHFLVVVPFFVAFYPKLWSVFINPLTID